MEESTNYEVGPVLNISLRARRTLSLTRVPTLSLLQGRETTRAERMALPVVFPLAVLLACPRNELFVTDGSGLMMNRKDTLFSISDSKSRK